MSKAGNAWRAVRGRVTGRPSNFSWLLDGRLAGSGRPMSRPEFDWLLSRGVSAVVTMTEEPLDPSWAAEVDWLHVPTPDLEAPSQDGLERAVAFIRERASRDPPAPVAVHCHAGLGRAGTVLACYLARHEGCGAGEAVSRVRAARPGSIQSPAQERAVAEFARGPRPRRPRTRACRRRP